MLSNAACVLPSNTPNCTGTTLNGFNTGFRWTLTAAPIVPTAVDEGPIAVTEGVPVVIPVGANDTGFTDPSTVTVTTQPTKGTINSINNSPGAPAGITITYTANVGATGAEALSTR